MIDRVVNIDITDEYADKRVDVVVASNCGISRSQAVGWIEEGLVTIKGVSVRKNYKVCLGDEITVEIPIPKNLEIVAQDIPLDILYEDEDLLVINKAKGMVVHPAAGNWDGTLVNALLAHCGDSLSGINGVNRPGIVHRLDKDTSGVMLVAKTDAAHQILAEQIQEHSVERVYHAVVIGHLREEKGTIDLPIGRNPSDRKKMCVTEKNSKNAVTHYEVIEEYPGFSYIKCKLETGRTHQIRVHMAHVSHPVLGDEVYGIKNNKFKLEGQCLHSKTVKFTHPITKKEMYFESELPEYFKKVLEKINL